MNEAAATGVPWMTGSSASPEPKFLGLCSPAWSLFCGCTLQTSVRFIGGLLFFGGGLRLVGSILTFSLDQWPLCLFDVCHAASLLTTGLLLWVATNLLDPPKAVAALYIQGAATLASRTLNILRFRQYGPVIYDRILEQLVRSWMQQQNTPAPKSPPEDIMRAFREIARETVNLQMAELILLSVLIIGGVFLLECYVVWSWVVRVKRRELALVLYGVQPLILPVATPVATDGPLPPHAQYVAVYPPTSALPPGLAQSVAAAAAAAAAAAQQPQLSGGGSQPAAAEPLLSQPDGATAVPSEPPAAETPPPSLAVPVS